MGRLNVITRTVGGRKGWREKGQIKMTGGIGEDKDKPKKKIIKDTFAGGFSFMTVLGDLTSRHFQTIYLTCGASTVSIWSCQCAKQLKSAATRQQTTPK